MSTNDAAVEEIKAHVLRHYVNGAFNARDLDAMRAGFHEEFAIFSAEGNALGRFHLADWIAKLEQSLADGYDAADPKNHWKHRFAHVEVTDDAAFVKLELHNEGVHIYTDFISLLRFADGWRIAAKVYAQHNERVNW